MEHPRSGEMLSKPTEKTHTGSTTEDSDEDGHENGEKTPGTPFLMVITPSI